MFSIAILIGVFSYIIFMLGITSLLFPWFIGFSLAIFLVGLIFYYKYIDKELHTLISELVKQVRELRKEKISLKSITYVMFVLFLLQITVNIIGVLGPELSFDALWYHLTLPKLFLDTHSIKHIPGGLLYYSDMPKLGEMLYVVALTFGTEIIAKMIHFLFGLLVCLSMYMFMKERYSRLIALLSVLIFYSNLVVGWESITAYVDLIRTFFEFLAFWAFINWIDSKDKKWLFECSVMLGLAISTKLLSIGSVGIFFVLIFIKQYKEKAAKVISYLLILLLSILIPLPWFTISFLNTGSPIYPFFTNLYKIQFTPAFSIAKIFNDSFDILVRSPDPLVPIYILVIPLLFVVYKYFHKREKYILYYCIISFVVWYLTPRTGGGRFLLPYLPVFSVLSTIVIEKVKVRVVRQLLVFSVILCSVLCIGYRGIANKKYIPVILGSETKAEFLTKNLNFSFGDFYDTDGYLQRTIKSTDKVLLYGFHNLYYIDFPFIDSSWVKKGDEFNYIATQNVKLPHRFEYWQEIYNNSKTHVKLYTTGGQIWTY